MNFFKSSFGIAVTVTVAVIGLGTLLFFMSPDEGPARPEPMGTEYPVQGARHIEVGTPHDPYNSNPPTSGPHYARAVNAGFYTQELADEQLIHNLEHGQIWVSYKDVDQATLDEIQVYQGRHRLGVVATRRTANEKPVCLASWGRLMCLDSWDINIAEDFFKANLNNSPEPIAR